MIWEAACAAATALRPAGRPTAAPTTTKVSTPAPTRSHSIGTWSASGPSTAIPIGIATAMTMPTKPKTRPWRSGSTVSWRSVIEEVEKNGTMMPTRNMKPKNTQMFGDRPSPIESTPNRSEDAMISPMRLRFAKSGGDEHAAQDHPDAEHDLQHREVDDVLLRAGVERAHRHERREIGRRDREQEDDREQQEQPAHEGVVRDVAHPVDEIGEVAGLRRRRRAARR